MEEEYIKTSIYVRKDVWEEFKSYVLNTYGSLKGYLGREVTEALGVYLRSAHTHKNLSKTLYIKNVRRKHLDLLTYIFKNSPLEIPRTHLLELITKLCGIDNRTKDKYMNFLVDCGFIVYDRGRGSNIIYKVHAERIATFLREHGIDVEAKEEEKTEKGKEIQIYARERYEAGDSVEEVGEKLKDFGLELGKKAVRNLIRRGGRNG